MRDRSSSAAPPHDEVLARGDLVAHQQVEDPLGRSGVGDPDPAQRAVARVHRGLGQLVGVHLAEALVALDRVLPALALALELEQGAVQLGVGVGVDVLVLALLRVGQLDPVQRRHGREDPAGLDHRAHVPEEQRQQQVRMCAPSTSASLMMMILP